MTLDAARVRAAVRLVDAEVRIAVQAKPRASREGVEPGPDDALVVRVSAPPVDGAANARIVEVLASALGVRKSAVRIARGETGRHKEVGVAGLDVDTVVARLAGAS